MFGTAKTALIAGAVFSAICAQVPVRAATLSTPEGMAVDTAGNLYVANESGNSVTIYSTSYAKTGEITAGLNSPSSVAVAPAGQVFVANYYGGNVTTYAANHAQGATLTDANVAHPNGIFLDGLGEIWVLDSSGTAHAYLDNFAAVGSYAVPATTAFTLWDGFVAMWGAPSNRSGVIRSSMANAGEVAHGAGGTTLGLEIQISRVGGVAVDGTGHQYVSDDYNGIVWICSSDLSHTIGAITPAFIPFGIAVDQVRGRIFISGGPFANKVAVYTLKAPYTLLTTIQ